jgi:hypothetical protein
MPPNRPPPSSGQPSGRGKGGKTPLVGGLPWLTEPSPDSTSLPGGVQSQATVAPSWPSPPQPAATFDLPPADVPVAEMPVIDVDPRGTRRSAGDRPRRRTTATPPRRPAKGLVVDMLGEEEAAEFLSIPSRIRARLDGWVRKSPPFTVSLSVHVAVLIALALIFVRLERKRTRPIDLSFASTSVVEAEK